VCAFCAISTRRWGENWYEASKLKKIRLISWIDDGEARVQVVVDEKGREEVAKKILLGRWVAVHRDHRGDK